MNRTYWVSEADDGYSVRFAGSKETCVNDSIAGNIGPFKIYELIKKSDIREGKTQVEFTNFREDPKWLPGGLLERWQPTFKGAGIVECYDGEGLRATVVCTSPEEHAGEIFSIPIEFLKVI